jgi:hypothetical protein
MKLLVLYDQYSTHTNTVYDHLQAFFRNSRHELAYCHGEGWVPRIQWEKFDAVVVHYSLRVAYGVISARLMRQIAQFGGVKVLFVQDEYDYTERTRQAIESLGIDMVYTCVPALHREAIYPSHRFPNVHFVETYTGFVPDHFDETNVVPVAQRSVVVGYRGRALPFWYGDLGQEKQRIAEGVRAYCVAQKIPHDIEWDDAHRIYGEQWLSFLGQCKATLGTESGANVFDYDGSLRQKYNDLLRSRPDVNYSVARGLVLGDVIEEPIMNQVSPRIFESIMCGTALVLFEGEYSGVVKSGVHFIPLRKDFSNIDEVFRQLNDDSKIQAMVDRAHADVILSGRYTFAAFVRQFDAELQAAALRKQHKPVAATLRFTWEIRPEPVRQAMAVIPGWLGQIWRTIPLAIRLRFKPAARRAWDFVGKLG